MRYKSRLLISIAMAGGFLLGANVLTLASGLINANGYLFAKDCKAAPEIIPAIMFFYGVIMYPRVTFILAIAGGVVGALMARAYFRRSMLRRAWCIAVSGYCLLLPTYILALPIYEDLIRPAFRRLQ